VKNQIDSLRQQHQSECASITTRIKEQCSSAYDTALVKLKGEYYKLEQHLRSKFEKDSINLQQLFEKRYSGQTTKKEYESKLSKLEVLNFNCQKDLESLRQTSKAELETVKHKYVQTLKRMRDELQINKKKSWERLEKEWVKRKQTFNDEWKNK
jgi:phospholipid N-methyltransferase